MQVEILNGRRLKWDHLANARDLGGYPTLAGGRMRFRAFVRSDTLSNLTEAGTQALLAYGVRLIVDLRYPQEVAERPNPLAQHPSVRYHHLSLLDPAQREEETRLFARDRVAWHFFVLEQRREAIACVMRLFIEAPEGGVLFHCFVGKDRTGLVAALLLDLADVPHEVIAADYHASEHYLHTLHQQWLSTFEDPEMRARMAALTTCPPEVMLQVLDELEARYGGAYGYLREAGLDEAEVRALRARLLA
ncbi:MAG: tyrosine-protein phosphatase [Thermoflexales bacterium]|nr:tyrosine-protein phosphatase [Thermoflexales bacterium]MCS7325005.1 tyrosine-protein phosphatase [Thermoflexales bacterium]MDW8053232.1 tyrosine-protein phosphatase [Anaerolineae bacterium]MDW8291883.1 tyrosine-protein phosphatase [Anaerolineae bacterium]